MAIRYRDPDTGKFVTQEKWEEIVRAKREDEGYEHDYYDEYDDPEWDSFGEEEYAE